MSTVGFSETETNALLSVADNVPEVETCRSLLNKQNNKQNNNIKSTSNMDETNVKQVAENEMRLVWKRWENQSTQNEVKWTIWEDWKAATRTSTCQM